MTKSIVGKTNIGPGGGPTAAGGYNYQAAVTAIALVYLGRGVALGWLGDLTHLPPQSAAAETGGPGDDLHLELAGGDRVEIQIKKGLRAGSDATRALVRLAQGLIRGDIAFGLLAVCPHSSRSLRQTAASDLVRLGENGAASVGPVAESLRAALGLTDPELQAVARRVRIVTVSALDDAPADIAAAKAQLAHLCAGGDDVQAAWDALYCDAARMIATRGRRSVSDVARRLQGAGVLLSKGSSAGAASILTHLCEWTARTNDSFFILGARQALSMDTAWRSLSLNAKPETAATPDEPAAALELYHSWGRETPTNRETDTDPDSLGQFFRHCVVVAGPGMGKSTLLRRLARRYAQAGRPVLRFSARDAAAAIRDGKTFEAAAFELGLDGSGLSPGVLSTSAIEDWVFLCDGLDETGVDQERVAEKLVALKAGRPGSRIIVTTRPIGYQTARFKDWRHYDIVATEDSRNGRNLRHLLGCLGAATTVLNDDDEFVEGLLGAKALRKMASTSPLMLGIAAALLASGEEVGETRIELFRAVFRRVQAEPPPRAGPPPMGPDVLDAVLDRLGIALLDSPLADVDATVSRIAEDLMPSLGQPLLRAKETVRACLAYWEALGVVETLRHGPRALLGTTHLMFAEYAAGRGLAALPPAEREVAVRARLGQPRWTEALIFAAAEGAVDLILEAYLNQGFSGHDGRLRLETALDVIALAKIEPNAALTTAIFDAARDQMMADDVFSACRIVLHLLRIPLTRARRAIAFVPALLNASHPWSRLCAWTIAAILAPDDYDLDAALNALTDALFDSKDRNRLKRGFNIDDPERNVLRAFAEPVLIKLLASRPIAEADPIIEGLLEGTPLSNFLFWRTIQPHLTRHGSQVNWMKGTSWAGKMPDFAAFNAAFDRAFGVILRGILPEGIVLHPDCEEAGPPPRPLHHLGALYRACGWGKMSLSDVWNWQDASDQRSTRAVYQAMIRVAALDHGEIVLDARQVLRALEDRGDTEPFSRIFGEMPHVDAPDVDWKSVDRDTLDVEGLKAAVLTHPSEMVVPLAVSLLDPVLSLEERRALVTAALAQPGEFAIWAGGALARGLPPEEAAEILLRDIVPGARGLDDRIFALAVVAPVCDSATFETLSPILLGPSVGAARAAAHFIKTMVLCPDQVEIVRKAEAYWGAWEKAQEGKARSLSARKDLFALLDTHDALTLANLLTAAEDTSVSTEATNSLVRRLSESQGLRAEFCRLCAQGGVTPSTMETLFRAKTPYSDADLESLEPIFTRADGRCRLSAIALLRRTDLPAEWRLKRLTKLRRDVEPLVRSHAARALESLQLAQKPFQDRSADCSE